MLKPKSSRLLQVVSISLACLLFPSVANATDDLASPAPSLSPTPATSDVPRPLYDIDSAASLTVVVNKRRPLNPITYAPKGKVQIGYQWLAKPAADAYFLLKAELKKQKLGTLCLNSGYRSFATQTATHNYQVNRGKQLGYDGEAVAARPGYSEHQTGLAADVSIVEVGCRINPFGATKASKWIKLNAYKFGFIVRYPYAQQATTGYIHEPWHLRFLGVDLATAMFTGKAKSLEAFMNLPAAPTY